MECPACGAEVAPATEPAIESGWRVPAEHGALTPRAEGEADAPPPRSLMRVAPPGSVAADGALVPAAIVARPLAVRAGAALPARLWRQPAVRAAVRTGVGALALSVGLRLARGWLARALARGDSPSLAEHLAAAPLPRPVARGGEVVETWVYVRQVGAGR